MKRVLWVLAALLVLVGALFGVAAYSANSLVARFKPDIERAASGALQASVTFGDISASIFPSVKLNVQEARIATQPGSSEALTLKGLVLHVKLLPLLLRRLVIETVSLDEPTVTVVKTKAGMFLEGLPRQHVVTEPSAPPAVTAPLVVEAPAAALNIDLRTFAINDATVTLRDEEKNREIALRNINLTAALSMAGGAATLSSVSLRADLPGKQRVSVNGTGQSFNMRSGELVLGDLKATVPGGIVSVTGAANVRTSAGHVAVSSDGIKLDDLLPLATALAPAVADIELHGSVQPDLKASFGAGASSASGNVTLQDVAFRRATLSVSGIAGLLSLTGDADKQTVTTDGISFVLRDMPGKVGFTALVQGNTVRIDPLTLSALSGSLSGNVESALSAPYRFLVRIDGSGFSVREALAVANPRAPVQMEGVVSKLAARVRGRGEGDVLQSLEGTVALGMKDGVLKGFNLSTAVMQAANRYPLLAAVVDAPRFQKKVSSKDTAIESLTGDFTIDAGWLTTSNLVVVSDLFRLTGSGRVSFETDVDLDTTITFNRELSEVMTGRAHELRPVLNADGTLSVPVIVKGRPPKFDVRPDMTRLIAGSTKKVLEGTVGKALEKALNGEKAGGNLLDRLFGK